MVIVILGILAGIAIPTFFNLQDEAKESATKGALGGIRSGISIWYAKEAASGTASWPALGQLTQETGGVMASGQFPENPYTGLNLVVEDTAEKADAAAGWIYDSTSGRIWSSATETQGSSW